MLGQLDADSVVKGIGGIGTVVESEQYLDTARIFMAPATMVNMTVGETIDKYIHSARYEYRMFLNYYLLMMINAKMLK